MRADLLLLSVSMLAGCANNAIRLQSDTELVRDGIRTARSASYWCFVPTSEQYRKRLDARLQEAARKMADLVSDIDIDGAYREVEESDEGIWLVGCKQRVLVTNSDLSREDAIVRELEYRIRRKQARASSQR